MRHFSFAIKDFRSIERVCGNAAGKNQTHPAMEYIHYVCKNGVCHAYGSNGFGFARVTVPYTTSDSKETDSLEYTFLMLPVKGPYGTDVVEIDTESEGVNHTAHMINLKDNSKSVDMKVGGYDGYPEDYEMVFDSHNQALSAKQEQGLVLSVKIDPRRLYDMLKGYMHCDSVMLQVYDPVRPIKIKSFPQEMEAESFIVPMRYR